MRIKISRRQCRLGTSFIFRRQQTLKHQLVSSQTLCSTSMDSTTSIRMSSSCRKQRHRNNFVGQLSLVCLVLIILITTTTQLAESRPTSRRRRDDNDIVHRMLFKRSTSSALSSSSAFDAAVAAAMTGMPEPNLNGLCEHILSQENSDHAVIESVDVLKLFCLNGGIAPISGRYG